MAEEIKHLAQALRERDYPDDNREAICIELNVTKLGVPYLEFNLVWEGEYPDNENKRRYVYNNDRWEKRD